MTVSTIRSAPVRNPALGLGILLGGCFCGAGLGWLLLANRVPHLDQFASQRNLALAIIFGLLALVPACRFMKSPARSFLSGITAWTIVTAMYALIELAFPRLATRLSAFHLFALGCVVFGFLAALAWVMNLVIMLRYAQRH
jgi:hypothetical protein